VFAPARLDPLAMFIGADYLFFDDKAHVDMLMSGVLLREVDAFIQGNGQRRGVTPRRKVGSVRLIFLISQMSQPVIGGRKRASGNGALPSRSVGRGPRWADGARLRKRIPDLLEALVAEGRIGARGRRVSPPHSGGRGVGEGLFGAGLAAVRERTQSA